MATSCCRPTPSSPAATRGSIRVDPGQADGSQRRGRVAMKPAIVDEAEPPPRQPVQEKVLGNAQCREERQLLLHDVDTRTLGVRLRLGSERAAGQPHLSAVRPDQARNDSGERRLPGAVRADERVHLTSAEVEIEIAQRRHRVAFLQAANLEDRDEGVRWPARVRDGLGVARQDPPRAGLPDARLSAVIRSTGVFRSDGVFSRRICKAYSIPFTASLSAC